MNQRKRGPMWYADTVGLHRVYERICQFEQQHGPEWAPAPLLKKLAESGKKFSDLDKDRSINRSIDYGSGMGF